MTHATGVRPDLTTTRALRLSRSGLAGFDTATSISDSGGERRGLRAASATRRPVRASPPSACPTLPPTRAEHVHRVDWSRLGRCRDQVWIG